MTEELRKALTDALAVIHAELSENEVPISDAMDRALYAFERAALAAPPAPAVVLTAPVQGEAAEVAHITTYMDGLSIPALDDNGNRLSLVARINLMTAKCVKAKKDLAESRYQTARVLEERLNAAEDEIERLRAAHPSNAEPVLPTPSAPAGAVDLVEEAKTAWGRQDGVRLYKALNAIAAALAAPAEGAQPSRCRGIVDSRCDYMAGCDRICNKCGREHDGRHAPPPAESAAQAVVPLKVLGDFATWVAHNIGHTTYDQMRDTPVWHEVSNTLAQRLKP